MNMDVYYLDRDHQRHGPVKPEALAACGVGPDSYVWMAGMKDWLLARDVPELAPYVSAASGPAVPGPARQSPGAAGYDGYARGAAVEPRYESGARPSSGNGAAVVGFVLAIFLLVCWIPGLNVFVCWLLALIFSCVGLRRSPRGLAVAGLVITLLLLVVFIVLLSIGISVMGEVLNL